jgi:hypothetical protein
MKLVPSLAKGSHTFKKVEVLKLLEMNCSPNEKCMSLKEIGLQTDLTPGHMLQISDWLTIQNTRFRPPCSTWSSKPKSKVDRRSDVESSVQGSGLLGLGHIKTQMFKCSWGLELVAMKRELKSG